MHKYKSSSALRLFEFVLWEESEKSRKHPEQLNWFCREADCVRVQCFLCVGW